MPSALITTIIHLEFHTKVTDNGPTNIETGAWQEVLTAISNQPYWGYTFWGPQIGDINMITIVIGSNS